MTLAEAAAWGQRTLTRHTIESAALDARLLLCHAADLCREDLIRNPEREFEADRLADFKALVDRRTEHEPVAYLTGYREFWGLGLECAPDVLIPRPDSETVVELALRQLPGKQAQLRILDLGTGTGALLLALLQELPNAQGVGTDISPVAVDLARRNAARLDLAARASFTEACWCDGLDKAFDLVISNPPYIAQSEINSLPRDVKDYEPLLALAAGADGLEAYRAISEMAGGILMPDGRLVVEIGHGQGKAVRGLFEVAGLAVHTAENDLNGIERALCFGKI